MRNLFYIVILFFLISCNKEYDVTFPNPISSIKLGMNKEIVDSILTNSDEINKHSQSYSHKSFIINGHVINIEFYYKSHYDKSKTLEAVCFYSYLDSISIANTHNYFKKNIEVNDKRVKHEVVFEYNRMNFPSNSRCLSCLYSNKLVYIQTDVWGGLRNRKDSPISWPRKETPKEARLACNSS